MVWRNNTKYAPKKGFMDLPFMFIPPGDYAVAGDAEEDSPRLVFDQGPLPGYEPWPKAPCLLQKFSVTQAPSNPGDMPAS